MDISFRTPHGRFNYRVSAVILRGGRLLTVRDNCYGYAYLPGGRVQMGETAETALLRELREELRCEGRILRPLWLCQDFFTEAETGEAFHEICLYFLAEAPELPDVPFTLAEGERINRFEWTPLAALKDAYFFPNFIKDSIFRLPAGLEIIAEHA